MGRINFKKSHTEAEKNSCVLGLQKCNLAIYPVYHILEHQVDHRGLHKATENKNK
jgi:hypothetical protein